MANQGNILYLPIHPHVLDMKLLVHTISEDMEDLIKLRKVITDYDDLNTFKEATIQIMAALQVFHKKCCKFEKDEVQEFLGLKITEMRNKLIEEEYEISDDKFKKHWVKHRGIELSHCLVRFLWLVLLMSKEQEKESVIQNVLSSLEQLSVGETHSSVMNCFVSSVMKGVESSGSVKMVADQKRETDELLGLILNEILSLEVVFHYPSLYPVVFLQSTTLDDILEKINEVSSDLVLEPDINAVSDQIMGSEIKQIWERLELPRTEATAVEDGVDRMKLRLNELSFIIQYMEKEISDVRSLYKNVLLVEEVKEFKAAIGGVKKQVEDLKMKVGEVAEFMENVLRI